MTVCSNSLDRASTTAFSIMPELSRQRGAATLLVAMVLLIASTLLILFTSGTSLTEQKMSANEYRAKQALAAAQAGIDVSIKALNDNVDDDGAGGTKTEFLFQAQTSNAGWVSGNAAFHARFCDGSVAVTALPTCGNTAAALSACTAVASDATVAWLVSCGWSDDNTARKRIITFVGKSPAAGSSLGNPLTAGGAVALTGNPTVVNYDNNLTIWTGDSVNNTGNNGKSVIRRPSTSPGAITTNQVVSQVGNGNQVCNVNQAPNLICTTTSTTVGPDVIANDTTLAHLTDDQFFENFMGSAPGQYQALLADQFNSNSVNVSDISSGGVYWLNGNYTLGNGTYGDATNKDPVFLIVDGDLTIQGSPNFYGVLYVRGNLDQSGSAQFRGGVIVEGNVSGNGSMNIIYDGDVVKAPNAPTDYSSYPGTWRDW